MKKDASRITFDRRKHYSSVRMQQGRVQLDADWNEQNDIIAHRDRTETSDIVGLCGGPSHHAAFHIVADISQLTTEERSLLENQTAPAGFKPPDFLISGGHYYVDGVLCENDQLTSYMNQPDLPAAQPISKAGWYLVYLDVWQRHLTALDDPSIREVALGGPDTATRTKTLWQVKYWLADSTGNCLTKFNGFDNLIPAATGTLRARTKKEQTTPNPCIVPPGAGYRGLENQLYRIEVHEGGAAFDVSSGGAGTAATLVPNTKNQVSFSGSAAKWSKGQAIEVFSTKGGSDPLNGTLAYITNVEGSSKTLTLNINVSDLNIEDMHLRAIDPAYAIYKWSRDNGVVVTTIENIKDQEIKVHDLGPDTVLGFQEGQWVEISDDKLELNGLPGQLVQITKIDRAINVVTLNVTPDPTDQKFHPKLRRWDGIGAIKFQPGDDHYLALESGVEVSFSAGTYKTGDYWTFPARTATADTQSGNIEWPQDANKKPVPQLPFGIKHRYCRLAMLHWDGTQFVSVQDCRNLFPPITELTNLFYVSGDGQEAMPDLTQLNLLVPLAQPLVVGVSNGQLPVPNARVRFRIVTGKGDGKLSPHPPQIGGPNDTDKIINVLTDQNGLARCDWQIDSKVQSQQVEAALRAVADPNTDLNDPADHAIGLPVIFTANLSVADQVAYYPGTCATLKDEKTVQKAIDQLSHLVSLYEVSGNNQEVMPGATLEPLQVLVANACGPVKEQKVIFFVTAGEGTVSSSGTTDANGVASATWRLDASTARQEATATLVDEHAPSITPPTSVVFVANLSIAGQVAYTPNDEDCPDLARAGVQTVQEALDELCKRTPQPDPRITIEHIATRVDNQTLSNDTLVPVERLKEGIEIICTGRIQPVCVGPSPDPPSNFPEAVAVKPTCFVTLDLPYPFGADAEFWRLRGIFGFQPLILACSVTVQENRILWLPRRAANEWLQNALLGRLSEAGITDRILAHLTLKGNFIWSEDDSGVKRYLDGEAFGTQSQNKRIDLDLSGDGRKGGDFEMWFWVTASPGRGIVLDVGATRNVITGSVRDTTGGALANVQVTLTALATGSTKTAITGEGGAFTFPGLVPGSYEVSVQVSGSAPVKKTVTVALG